MSLIPNITITLKNEKIFNDRILSDIFIININSNYILIYCIIYKCVD